MSALGTSPSRGSRANVGSPPYLGTTVASTWPTIPSTVTRGSAQGSGRRSGWRSGWLCGLLSGTRWTPADRLQFAIAGLDRGALRGQVQRPGRYQIHQTGHDQADQPRVVHAVGEVRGNVPLVGE